MTGLLFFPVCAAEVCELAYHGNLEGLQLLLENGVSANVKVRIRINTPGPAAWCKTG